MTKVNSEQLAMYDIHGEFIQFFRSAGHAALALNVSNRCIHNHLLGNNESIGIWVLIEAEEMCNTHHSRERNVPRQETRKWSQIPRSEKFRILADWK